MLFGLGRRQWAVPAYNAINWSHPLTRGLMIAVPGWHALATHELVSGRLATTTANMTVGTGAYGRGLQLDGTTAGTGTEWSFASGDTWAIAPPLTVGCVFHKVSDNGSNNGTLFGVAGGGIAGEVWRVGYIGATQFKFAFNDNTSAIEVGTTSATGVRGIHSLVGTLNSGGSTLYYDGQQNATGAGASAINYTATVRLVAGRTQGPLADIVYLGVAWRRVLSAVEVAQFHADPFAMFRPRGIAGASIPPPGRRPIFMRF